VILDLKGSDFNYTYQTPPASPSNMSRRSSISSYQCGSVRHVPSLDSISCAVDGVHLQPSSPYLLYGCDESGRSLSEGNSPSRLSRRGSRGRYGSTADYGRHVSRRDMTTDAVGSTNQLASAGGPENGLLAPPHNTCVHQGERARAMSASGKSCSARDQLMLGGLNSDAPRSSRDSLHCSSGYSTQTTTPSCSEDTIHTHSEFHIQLLGPKVSSMLKTSLNLNWTYCRKSRTITGCSSCMNLLFFTWLGCYRYYY
ncbi:hypothetical protein CHARACLAT_017327, partial [Characodon lateralis]|nr:hypothetical protein [Characodon lateralis]